MICLLPMLWVEIRNSSWKLNGMNLGCLICWEWNELETERVSFSLIDNLGDKYATFSLCNLKDILLMMLN